MAYESSLNLESYARDASISKYEQKRKTLSKQGSPAANAGVLVDGEGTNPY